VIHVLDASKSVPVASTLTTDAPKTVSDYVAQIKTEYAQLREDHAKRQDGKAYISLEQARNNKLRLNWQGYQPPKPSFLGTKVFMDYPLEDLVPYIDWTPFFQSWELAGRFPQILSDSVVGEEATRLYADARQLLDKLVKEKLIEARAVIGFFPANAITDDDLAVFSKEDSNHPLAILHHLRQQNKKADKVPNLCLTDYIAPESTGYRDYIGGFAVTAGVKADELARKYELEHDDYNSIMVKALADRFAEALAERMHQRVRKEFWGYATEEKLDNEQLIREKYRGIRPAPGYPACPDHLEKGTLFQLLDVEETIGISLTESYAMHPAASVSGWYLAHPEARYFGLGKIQRDQLEDYAQRVGRSVQEMERWLGSIMA
jgi:5-methyltetrahydrofolate--homocysteine methyltransferase